jgi:Arc/MetJ family transcription regulator
MQEEYDFSRGRRGPVLPPPAGKTRITIRIDDDILEWFREQVDTAEGRKSYQSMINQTLREYMMHEKEPLEVTLRRVVREELAKYTVNQADEKSDDDQS